MKLELKKKMGMILIIAAVFTLFFALGVSAGSVEGGTGKIDVGTGNAEILSATKDVVKLFTGTAYEIIKWAITAVAVVLIAWNAFAWYTNQTPQSTQKMKTSMVTGFAAIVLVWSAPYLVGWVTDALNQSSIG